MTNPADYTGINLTPLHRLEAHDSAEYLRRKYELIKTMLMKKELIDCVEEMHRNGDNEWVATVEGLLDVMFTAIRHWDSAAEGD